ncbi:unnamed protein product [Closterium sp. NIES-64]|nr:unnamed protein product [Closterium sp. NIES-64]
MSLTSFDLTRYLLTSLVLISLLAPSHLLAVCSTHDNGADADSPRTASQPLAQTLHPHSLVLPRRRLQAGADGRRGKIQLERPVAAAEPQHQAVIDGGVRPAAVTASKPPAAILLAAAQGRREAADTAAGNAGSRERTQGGSTLKEGILGKSLTQVGLIDYFSKRIGPAGRSKSKPRLPLCPEFAPPLAGASPAVVSACQWGDPLSPSYSATADGLGSSGSELGSASLGGPGKAAQFMGDWLRWKREGGEAAERECMRQRGWFYAGIAEETCDLSALRAAQAASPWVAAEGAAAADVDGSGGGILVLRDVYVNAQGLVFNKSHVFVVDRCGSGQWKQQQPQQQQVKVPSYPPGTRVTVHPHLINLLPYEGHEEEEEEDEEQTGGSNSSPNGGNPEGREWVAQARLHNSKERLVARLLPALFLLSSALMPAARRFPLLLADRHVLFHLGLGVFGTDLSSLAISPESPLLGDSRDHLFFAKQLYVPIHVSSLCGLSAAGRPSRPDALWLALRANHLLPRGGLPILNPDWTPNPPAPYSHNVVLGGRSVPRDWVVVVSLVWKARALFSRALLLVGPTSPALSNLIFLPFNATVIEILPYSAPQSTTATYPFLPTTNISSPSSSSSSSSAPLPFGIQASVVSQQDSATWHYRLAERAGVRHFLSACDPGWIKRELGEQCHVSEVYSIVMTAVRSGWPAWEDLANVPHHPAFPPATPPAAVTATAATAAAPTTTQPSPPTLPNFQDAIPGSRLQSRTGAVQSFRQWLSCVATRGEWRYNPTPRVLPWNWKSIDHCDMRHVDQVKGGVAYAEADEIARQGGRDAEKRWRVREELKYEWVVPRGRCPAVAAGAFGSVLGPERPLKQQQDPKTLPFGWGQFKRQNELLRGVVEEMGAVFMDIEPMTALRPDGHRGRITEQKTDCLHYCSPGPEDAWSEFLYNIIQRIVPEY